MSRNKTCDSFELNYRKNEIKMQKRQSKISWFYICVCVVLIPFNILRLNISLVFVTIIYLLTMCFGLKTFMSIFTLMKKLHSYEFNRTEKNMKFTVGCLLFDWGFSCAYYIAIITY